MNYPDISIREESGNTSVYWDNKLIVEIKENKHLRFRATHLDEKWVGTDKKGADMGWAYRDTKAAGMEVLSVNHENKPGEGEFVIRINGKKPQFDSSIYIEFKGIWMPEADKFKYTYSTNFECLLEDWYVNSNSDKISYPINNNGTRAIEAIDYTIEYISDFTAITSKEHKGEKLYQWYARSMDGTTWKKWPMTHVPYPTRGDSSNYITIEDYNNVYQNGEYFGFLDNESGGWITKIEKTSSSVSYGICWSQFDVHVLMPDAVPQRGSTDKMKVELSLEFNPLDEKQSLDIINSADEINWRAFEEYKLPLSSLNNRFDTLITDIPGEDIGKSYMWWANSFECYRDDTVGYDDNYSATIKKLKDSVIPAAWNTFTWNWPFVTNDLRGKRVKFSAMVKTSDLSGFARIAVASSSNYDIYYGVFNNVGTHNRDGSYVTDRLTWQFSESLTGTNDWTLVSMEFVVKYAKSSLILEQHGIGQTWFDNVKIEDLGMVQTDHNTTIR